MKPVNVLYLVRTWALGGSHTIILNLLKHMPRDRFRLLPVVYDAHSGGDEKFSAALEREGHEVLPERIPWRSRRAWFRARDTLASLIRTHDIGLLHTHDPHSNVLAGLGRNRWPCACVASPYGWWDRLFPLRSRLYVRVERNWALPNFERVITVSETMKRKILRGPADPERIRVINTGLDLDALAGGRSREETRAKLGIPADAFVAGTVSRIYIEKGHTYLLQALQRMAASHPEARLLIVGDGPVRPALEQEARERGIAERVVFTGYYDDIPGALRAMDVFTLPTILEEGFPTAVLEAEAMGVPVVATDKGGTFETMDVGETGLLVPPKDAAALAQTLTSLHDDPERRRQMGATAHAFIRGRFTLADMVAKVAATYDEALAEFAARQ